MIKFEFQINKYYLLVHALARSTERKSPFKKWVDLQDRLYKKSKEAYFLITGISQWRHPYEYLFIESVRLDHFRKICKSARDLLKEGIASPEFKHLYRETKKYLKCVEKQWDKNKKIALDLLSEITGLGLPKKKIRVLVVHPKIHTGRNFPEINTICWGHREEWKNYSTIYLCHELLHILVYQKLREPILMHALIELATDQELRIKLNKKGEYFEVCGHKSLQKLEKLILPFWKDFLKNKKEKDIFGLEKKLLKNKKVRGLIKEIKNTREG